MIPHPLPEIDKSQQRKENETYARHRSSFGYIGNSFRVLKAKDLCHGKSSTKSINNHHGATADES
jgi:hypothetical protein